MSAKTFATTFRAGALALALIGFAVPAYPQTSPGSGMRAPAATDVIAQNIEQQRALQRRYRIVPRATTGAAGAYEPAQDSDSGSKVGQPGAAFPTMLPGGPSGAPVNPCTPAQKAQDRC